MKRSIVAIAIGFVLLIGLSVSGEAADFIISPNQTTFVVGNDGKKFKVNPGDMIEYYAETDTAMLIFDGDNFVKGRDKIVVNIDAYADNLGDDEAGNARLLISTTDEAKLGDVTFTGGDLVEVGYNYGTHTVEWAEIFLSRDRFSSGNENIDAVWYLPDSQEIVFSTETDAKLGGLKIKDGDLVKYNPATDVATLIFSEDDFSGLFADLGMIDVTAVAPIPGAIWLLGSGIAGLAGLRIRKKKSTVSHD